MSKDVAVFAKGTLLERGNAATPEVFEEIKGITKWDPDPGGAGDPEKIDVTSGSTSGLVREDLDGYSALRPGKVDFEMLVDLSNSVHAALSEDSITGVERNYVITIPTTTTKSNAAIRV